MYFRVLELNNNPHVFFILYVQKFKDGNVLVHQRNRCLDIVCHVVYLGVALRKKKKSRNRNKRNGMNVIELNAVHCMCYDKLILQ